MSEEYTGSKEKKAGTDLVQYESRELNKNKQEVSVFMGNPYQQANADTFDDFREDRLQWDSIAGIIEIEEMMQALVSSDLDIVHMEDSSDGEWEQNVFDTYMDNYLELLMKLISMIICIKESSQCGRFLQQLEVLLRWRCCLVSREDWIMIPGSHPMELAVRTFNRWVLEAQPSKDVLTYEILESQKRRRSRYMIYSTDQVYLRNYNSEMIRGAQKGIPFRKAEKLTEISSVRLIEKVEHYINTRKEIQPGDCIRVACLGEIAEPWKLGGYYKSTSYQVELIQLKRDKGGSGLVFSITDSYPEEADRNTDRRRFNLLKLSDLEMLFRQYNIVLFMDEGCFYCQGQEDRTVEERMVQSQFKWIWETARKETKRENRILYYKQAYKTAGEWLNSLNSGVTARMQFSEKLFKAIQSVMAPQYEVYLYVSYGKRIPVQDLYNRDVCNDENYDGRELAVYKMPSQSKDISREVAGFLKVSKDKRVTIDIWKMIKSISNTYYIKFLEMADIEDEYLGIRLLRNMSLEVSWPDKFTDQSMLEFRIEKRGDQLYYEQAGNFINEVLEKGFLQVKHTCVKKYLHRLVGNAIISRAMNVEGILVGYLLREGFFDSRVSWEGFSEQTCLKEGNVTCQSSLLFEPRRTVLSVINNLNMAWIRDYDRKEEYLFYEFRNRICPSLSEEVFEKLMKAIHGSCKNLGYVENRLYYHSEL